VNAITRRNLLKALLGGALQAAATVVLARAVPVANAESTGAAGDVQTRADRIAEGLPASADGLEPVAFANGGFRNGGGGGFRKGGFANGGGGGGGFKNGGFANGGGGGGAFKNGGFANGGGGGGAFKNGAFRNY
jgi:hypothetical protein